MALHVLIIGNGIAGTTAARHLRKLDPDCRITMVSAETRYPYSRTALMYLYMGHQHFEQLKLYEDFFYPKNRIDLLFGKVSRVSFADKTALFHDFDLDRTQTLSYDKLIIATGSLPQTFNWPGEDLDGVGTLVSWQDLQQLEASSHEIEQAVVVGGGLIGIELAEMLKSRGKSVTFLVRENSYWNKVLPQEESEMINRHIREHHIDLRLGTELAEILSDSEGKLRAVRTTDGEEIPCQYVGLTTGVRPNLSFETDHALELEKGILVDDYLQTNLPDVFAIGDCAQMRKPLPHRQAIEAVWYVGKMMGEVVAHNVLGREVAYRPGIWFNSAKFLDIEYQVYGTFDAQLAPPLDSLYWEHPKGRKSIRVVYDQETRQVKGFNLMGLRFRHPVCDAWLKKKAPLEEVLVDLAKANFDPEFFASYEGELQRQYQEKSGLNLPIQKKRKKILGLF